MTEAALTDKTLRSVFVGNIPYEVSEEKLKEIFSEVGPVVSFKLVFDRDSGKPKGYGFCEYKDQETALSAMRNLNNYEIAGRNLRVDNACTEKSRLEMQSLMQSAQNESQYGDIVSSEKAPEAISKAVASLPPEQMYELMKQMKQCIQNNPAEARQMLLQNPQLAYALLQAQIVMRIVDPQTALSILHPYNAPPPTLIPPASNDVSESDLKQQSNVTRNPAPVVTSSVEASQWNNVSSSYSVSSPQVINSTVSTIQAPPPPPPLIVQDMDMRADIRPPNRFADQDLRIPPSPMMGAPMFDPYGRPSENPMDSRTQFPIPRPPIPAPNMAMSMQPTPGIPMPVTTQNMNTSIPRMPPPPNLPLPRPALQPTTTVSVSTAVPSAPPAPKPPTTTSGADSEKAALIMQVLQLTDEQIAMLPAEQRQSILLLKEQIAKSTKQR